MLGYRNGIFFIFFLLMISIKFNFVNIYFGFTDDAINREIIKYKMSFDKKLFLGREKLNKNNAIGLA